MSAAPALSSSEILDRFTAALAADEDTAMLPTMLEPYRLMLGNTDGVVATIDKLFQAWVTARGMTFTPLGGMNDH